MIRFFISILLLQLATKSSAQIDSIGLDITLDSLIQVGLDSNAYPGAQVVVLFDNKILYQKSHGYHTYDKVKKVQSDDLYDLASITKVTTGLPILIQLHGEGKFDPEKPIAEYLHSFKNSNKENIIWKEVLTHQAGMIPWIPHWQKTLRRNNKYRARTFKSSGDDKYSLHVNENLFLHRRYIRKIIRAIRRSHVNREHAYLYSGIMFYMIPQMIENISGVEFEKYLKERIFDPIGAEHLRYRPLSYFSKNRIVPTEYDTIFRKTMVHGFVHDEGAAMMGGISCNAGLFGNAHDLAQLGNLFASMGIVNGDTILHPSSVKYFTSAPFAQQGNRRGLGFDKPLLQVNDDTNSPCSLMASPTSFGHSGFTGTYMWIDPESKLVFVFLSNRVHPSRTNRKLYSMNLRQKMHQACYLNLLSK